MRTRIKYSMIFWASSRQMFLPDTYVAGPCVVGFIAHVINIHVGQCASCQLRKKTMSCACAGNAGNVSQATDFKGNLLAMVSDPGMHHGTWRDACR